MSQFADWTQFREKNLAFVDDADWEGGNDLAGARGAGLLGVPLLVNGSAPVRGVRILAQAIVDGQRATPAGSMTYVLSEVVNAEPAHLITTGLGGTLTVGTAEDIDFTTVGALLGTGIFALRVHTDNGLAGAGLLRFYFKVVTG